MNRVAANKLAPGIYRVFWKEGGSSLASVGQMCDGSRWLAPTNWLSPATDHGLAWRRVKSVKRFAAAGARR